MSLPSRRALIRAGLAAAALVAAASPASASAQSAGRIGPLDLRTQDSMAPDATVVEAGGIRYFAATTPSGGTELWKHTSGTPVRVADIAPGRASSAPTELVALGNELLFSAAGPDGRELYRTDGTTTTIVKDIRPGSAGAQPSRLVVSGALAYFAADDGTHGTELWKTDGTAAGTQLVEDINPGAAGAAVTAITAVDGGVALSASSPGAGAEPWFSDGTAAGTEQLADIRTGTADSFPGRFVSIGDDLFFTANATGASNDASFWRFDGTLHPVSGLPAGPFKSINGVVGTDTRVYFSLFTFSGTELWTIDADDTVRQLQSVNPGSAGVTNLSADGDDLYYAADNGITGFELYRTTGTDASITNVSGDLTGYQPSLPVRQGTALYFTTTGDGAAAPIYRLADGSSLATAVTAPSVVLGRLNPTSAGLVVAGRSDATGVEPYVFDGTALTALGDLNTGLVGDRIGEIAGVGRTAYFTRQDGSDFELRRTDGVTTTLAGTFENDSPRNLTAFGDKLVFSVYTDDDGTEPWITDGTAGGTTLLADLAPGGDGSDPQAPHAAGGAVWFPATDGDDMNLYRSTGSGATKVATLLAGQDYADDWTPLGFTGGKLWFLFNEQVWTSDGTTAGTVPVALPAGAGTEPRTGVLAGDTVYVGTESALVAYAATGAPRLVTDFDSAWRVEQIVALGTKVVFTARDMRPRGGPVGALWASDGTPAGTGPIGAGLDSAQLLTPAGKHVYFAGTTTASGYELFRTDGTAAGTELASDVTPGPDSGFSGRLVAVGADVVFDGDQGIQRITPAKAVTTLYDHSAGTVGGSLVRVGGSVLFGVTELGADSETLWSTPAGLIGPEPAVPADPTPGGGTGTGTGTAPIPVPPLPAPGVPAPLPAPRPAAPKPFGITKFSVDAKRGVGTLTVRAPGTGSLKITADGIRTIRRTLRSGTTKIVIRPGTRAARTLKRTGRYTLTLRLRYVARGSAQAVVVTRKVTLRRS